MSPSVLKRDNKISEFAPAKINLNLEVLDKRPDGYHNIRSLMIPLDYGDDVGIEIDKSSRGIECVCDRQDIPSGEGNIAWKAARAFLDATGIEAGVGISITKRIPQAAGLAGGSSDAAAVFRGLNKYFGAPLSGENLIGTAMKVGSDVPFLLERKPAMVEGRGEILTAVEAPVNYVYLVVTPSFGIDTGWAYRQMALTEAKRELKIRYSQIGGIELHNSFEAIVFEEYPQLENIKQKMLRGGALGSLMSGSGSSIFGVFQNREGASALGGELAEEEIVHYFTARLYKSDCS